MAKPLVPSVRLQFAKRLKEMRAQSGFTRARYFAKSLGIEENRYTRYERAEVEPSLSLIHKMCEALRVSPNQLLGYPDAGAGAAAPGFSEHAPAAPTLSEDFNTRHIDLLAWRLASTVAAVRSRSRRVAKAATEDPLAPARDTALLFQRLQREPFGTVAEIAADETLTNLEAKQRLTVADQIKAFTDAIADRARTADAERPD